MRYILINNWQTDNPEIMRALEQPMIFSTELVAREVAQEYPNAIVIPLSKNLIDWSITSGGNIGDSDEPYPPGFLTGSSWEDLNN